MYYISDYRKRAIDKIIPYLIEFPQIVKIIEQSADRYQAIEDLLWSMANNLKVDDARGVFLDAIAHNEVTEIIYTDMAKDAFTYGSISQEDPNPEAYGLGHYYDQYSYISGIRKNVSEDKLIRAIKAKIIENNTNCSVEDFLEALQLYFNADRVKVYESYPLSVSATLVGKNLELSSSENREIIKRFLPACVSLRNLYVDEQTYDIAKYDGLSSLGQYRYPILISDTIDIYTPISFSTNLNSLDEEHILTKYDSLDNNMYCCITGKISDLYNEGTIISSHDTTDGTLMAVQFIEKTDGYVLSLNYNNTTYESDKVFNVNDKCTLLLCNNNNTLELYVVKNISLSGNNLDQDTSYITGLIQYTTPDVSIPNYEVVHAPIFINCIDSPEGQFNFGDFTYYGIVFGNFVNNSNIVDSYYISSFGEKSILFNCLINDKHLDIISNNELRSNLYIKQSDFNYKTKYSNGKYLYLDGKSGIYYNWSNNKTCDISNINIEFETCMPTYISDGNIIGEFCGVDDKLFTVNFTHDGSLELNIPTLGTDTETPSVFMYNVLIPNVITINEYAKFEIQVNEEGLQIYKNDINIHSENYNFNIQNILSQVKVGYNTNLTKYFKGFIKNLNLSITGIENDEEFTIFLNLPFENTLKDYTESITYTNLGARFITTPQLINDTTNLDLYGNPLLGSRN